MDLKKIILAFVIVVIMLFAFAFFVRSAHALDLTLQWDPNTEPDLAGYIVYQAEFTNGETGPWQEIATLDKDTTTLAVTIPDDIKFAWLVTAVDTEGNQSFVSNLVEYINDTRPRPLPPVNVRVFQ